MGLQNFLPLRREVMEHWVYKDSDYFKVWVEMLFKARFSKEPKKDIYDGSFYTLNYSEFLFSRPKWSQRLSVSEHKLRKLICLLENDGMIIKTGRVGKSGATIYAIKNYDKYNNLTDETPALPVENSEVEDNSSQPNANESPANNHPNANESPLKKNVKNVKSVKFEVYFDNEPLNKTFIEFIEFRKQIKKPMSELAKTKMIKKLSEIAETDEDKIKILENSIINNWSGVFALRENKQQKKSDGTTKPSVVIQEVYYNPFGGGDN